MRKWALFLLLASAIAAASWWHESRFPDPAKSSLSTLAPDAPDSWDPETLRDTSGEIVLGGGPAVEEAPPTASPIRMEREPATTPSSDPKQILSKPEPARTVGEESYVVKSGDTLGAIAKRKYGSAAPRYVEAIMKKNAIKNPDALSVGAKLVLPAPASLKK